MTENEDEIVSMLSSYRLQSFGLADKSKSSNAIENYTINLQFCCDIYKPLHLFEVCFRNKVHKEVGKIVGQSDWLLDLRMDGSVVEQKLRCSRGSSNAKALESIKKYIRNTDAVYKKDKNKNPTEADLVSRQMFGFWTTFIDSPFDQTLTHKKLIKHIFPDSNKSYSEIRLALDNIRKLRNRFFHHEPIRLEDREVKTSLEQYLNILSPSICRRFCV